MARHKRSRYVRRGRRNPVRGGVRLLPSDVRLLRSIVKWVHQSKGGRKKFRPFGASVRKVRPLRGGALLARMSAKELRQFVSGGGWGAQGVLAGARKHSQIKAGLRGVYLRGKVLRAADKLKSAAQKRHERSAGTYKAPPPVFWGYKLYRRLSPVGRRSVRRVLKHFAARPRYVVDYDSEIGKMGPGVTATYSPRSTCPTTCGFWNDCYANEGNVRSNWIAASLGLIGLPWKKFLAKLRASPNQKVRVNIAGDLPGDGKTIDRRKAYELASAASKGRRRTAWTYTHYPVTRENLKTIHGMRRLGLQVNLSADNLKDADAKARTGLDVAVVIPENSPDVVRTRSGRRVLKCPAIMAPLAAKKLSRSVSMAETCSACGGGDVLCASKDRNYIIGFPKHGQLAAKERSLLKVGKAPTMSAEQRSRMLAAGIAVNPRRRWRR